MNRAYSLITLKSVDEDKRILSGVATTPTPDRMNDVVEPKGAEFSLPIPFLWQHDASQPIGHVTKAKVTKDGIEVQVQLAKIAEPGTLKDRIDEAWQSIKAGLVRGLSIGFKALEFSRLEDGGLRFLKWSWLELSAVTIPANGEATITAIKSASAPYLVGGGGGGGGSYEPIPYVVGSGGRGSELFIPHKSAEAASGRERSGVVRLTPPGASGLSKTTIPKEPIMARTIQEQITDWTATRTAKSARMTAIMDGAAEKGETLDAALETEYDDLKSEVVRIDKHLERLQDMSKISATKATPVSGDDPESASRSRASATPGIQVLQPRLEKGIGFTRYVMCMAAAKGDPVAAERIAKQRFPEYAPLHSIMKAAVDLGGVDIDLIRKAVAAGTTSHADHHSALVNYQDLAGEFVEWLRPTTIIGKFGTGNIPGLRQVPFNIRFPRQTSKASAGWVGEGLPKPVTSFNSEQVTLDFFKVAAIIALTQELVRFSSPSAEAIVREELGAAVRERIDIDFVDPSNAGTANVKPASITNGATAITSAGDTAANVRSDVQSIMSEFIQLNMPISSGVWITNENVALALSLMMNDLGQPEFPGIGPSGGTFATLPVITSQYVPSALMILAAANQILLADDGNVSIDASREASLEMLDSSLQQDGTAGTGASLVSMFQTNMIAIRAEREINWRLRRTGAVQYLSSFNPNGTAGSGDI